MVFSSLEFLFYFLPIVLAVYYLAPQKAKNYILLIASLLFYAWGAPDFIFIFLTSIILNFFISRQIFVKSEHPKQKKWLLACSLFMNLGLLAYFKYMNFFVDNINYFLQLADNSAITFTKIALPIGISFFTFQSLTYTVDIYREVSKPLNKLTDYMLYISMFPQLIAGPIVRYNSVADQLVHRTTTLSKTLVGFYRFVIGLSKKVLIANTLALMVDDIFAMDYLTMGSMTAWLGLLSYTFQIYFDFSGYSDMAIGLGMMFGFRFPENFENPYTSRSITEFWRRWHCTLGVFMKEYLYIPLGGNRVSKLRMYFNLIVVFLLSGLWHGASYNFILWGAYHGMFLIFDKLCGLKFLKMIGEIPATLVTFLIAALGWVLFRVECFPDAIDYYTSLFAFRSGAIPSTTPQFWTIFALGVFFSFFTISKWGKIIQNKVFADSYPLKRMMIFFVVSLFLFLLSAGSLSVSDFNPFIYFRF